MILTKNSACIEELAREWRVTPDEASLILDILDGTTTYVLLYEEDKIDQATWRKCDRIRDPQEQKLTLVDALSEGTFGVSSYGMDGDEKNGFFFIQTGDLYNPAIAWDNQENTWLLTTEMDVRAACELRAEEELLEELNGV